MLNFDTWVEKKCTTEIMADGSDLGVGVATGTVGRRSWEDYAPALVWLTRVIRTELFTNIRTRWAPLISTCIRFQSRGQSPPLSRKFRYSG